MNSDISNCKSSPRGTRLPVRRSGVAAWCGLVLAVVLLLAEPARSAAQLSWEGSGTGLTIADSSSVAEVRGRDFSGGFLGALAGGSVHHCYSAGAVVATGASPGGFLGSATGEFWVDGCYWDTQASRQNSSAGGVGRNSRQMRHPYPANTYSGWDFAMVWAPDAGAAGNSGYPILRPPGAQIGLSGMVGSRTNPFPPAALSAVGEIVSISGLPPGVRYDPRQGTFVGVPQRAGSFQPVARIRLGDGTTRIREFGFSVAPIPAWAVGSFTGLVSPSQPVDHSLPGLGGWIRITSSASGAYSGTLQLANRRFAIRGQIVAAPGAGETAPPPTLVATIVTNPKVRFDDIHLQLELQPEFRQDSDQLAGTLLHQGEQIPLQAGWRHRWNAKTNPAFGGRTRSLHVLLLTDGPSGPEGAGFAAIRVDPAGNVRWVGMLADGARLGGSFVAAPGGGIPLYAWLPYAGGGSVMALFDTIRNGDRWRIVASPDPAGCWMKRPTPAGGRADRIYPEGFDLGLEVVGGEYLRPPRNQLLFGASATPHNLELLLAGGGIETVAALAPVRDGGLVRLAAQLQAGNRIALEALPGLPATRVGFNPATGLMTLNLALSDPVGGRPIRRNSGFRGLVLPFHENPHDGMIGGYFLLPALPAAGESPASTLIHSGIGVLQTTPPPTNN